MKLARRSVLVTPRHAVSEHQDRIVCPQPRLRGLTLLLLSLTLHSIRTKFWASDFALIMNSIRGEARAQGFTPPTTPHPTGEGRQDGWKSCWTSPAIPRYVVSFLFYFVFFHSVWSPRYLSLISVILHYFSCSLLCIAIALFFSSHAQHSSLICFYFSPLPMSASPCLMSTRMDIEVI